jgi:hypothetical protein
MFEKTRTVSQVICFFTSTSKADDDIIRDAVRGVYADHYYLKRANGSTMPPVEKMATKVLGNVLYTQDRLGLARVKPEFLPVAIRAYGDFAREIDSRPSWG